MKCDRPWTKPEIDRAIAMRKAGRTRAQIAYTLGRTEKAVTAVFKREGIRLAETSQWSPEEDAIVRARKRGVSWAKVAVAVSALGRARSAAACRGRARTLKGDKPASREPKVRRVSGDDAYVRALLLGLAEIHGLKVAA